MIRDDEENKLITDGILPGGKDEVSLLIQDRNLDLDDAQSTFNGKILHKTETSTAEMFGPYTMVNGALWPQLDVGAGPVRFRILNGSNARTYCLKLVRANVDRKADGSVHVDYTEDLNDPTDPSHVVPMWQVGTDGGLLGFPVKPTSMATFPASSPTPGTVVNRGLILASAERADIVIDFSALKPGDTVALVNTAFAPFHGSTVSFPYLFANDGTFHLEDKIPGVKPGGQAPGTPLPGARVPYPDVILFNVAPTGSNLPGAASPSPLTSTTPLSQEFRRYVHKASHPPVSEELVIPENHVHRWIALTEFPPGKLYFRELEELTQQYGTVTAFPAGVPVISVTEADGTPNGTQRWFQTTAMRFHDALRIQAEYGGWEIWNFINLTVDSHPIHIHLVEFQVLDRIGVDASVYVSENGATMPGKPIDETNQAKALLADRKVDPNESGYKDTVRVNPGEVVKVAAKFDGFRGRYMYHCHILEHEDMDMMRPFVVATRQAIDAMNANGMSGGGMSM